MKEVAPANGLVEMGLACPECIELLGSGYPWRFSTREQYETTLKRFPEPAFSEEAYAALTIYDDPEEAYQRTFIDLSS